MSNAEKIEILKQNIKNFIINLKIDEENSIFNFAKQQAKEMRIEITMGEIKSIIYDIINSIKIRSNHYILEQSDDFNFNQNISQKLIETSELITFEQSIDI